MNQGPLTEKELEWLDELLAKYSHDKSILDVSELDGMLTAILSSPSEIDPDEWLLALWGGAEHVPNWANERELDRFMNLTFQHMNDIGERLFDYPEQFEPLFGEREVDGTSLTIVEEWCYGYMRGVALRDWSTLPESLKPSLAAIALHGDDAQQAQLDDMEPQAFIDSFDAIRPAALELHAYWVEHQAEPVVQQPHVAGNKPGRNDPCSCGSGKKYKQCCLH